MYNNISIIYEKIINLDISQCLDYNGPTIPIQILKSRMINKDIFKK
jgi:hypothetical protein